MAQPDDTRAAGIPDAAVPPSRTGGPEHDRAPAQPAPARAASSGAAEPGGTYPPGSYASDTGASEDPGAADQARAAAASAKGALDPEELRRRFDERPELGVAVAFAGGFLLAQLLKAIGR